MQKLCGLTKALCQRSWMGVKFLNMPARDKDAILKEINIVAVL